RSRALGLNENRTKVVVDNVVLLVRDELLRRYPHTDIFAGKAKAGADGEHGRVLDETDERHPIFRGTLAPDITFFGFNLSVRAAPPWPATGRPRAGSRSGPTWHGRASVAPPLRRPRRSVRTPPNPISPSMSA